MTEEEVRAIIAAAFAKAATDTMAQVDPERNIQVDTALTIVSNICDAIASEVAVTP
jgi:hypothetical protein